MDSTDNDALNLPSTDLETARHSESVDARTEEDLKTANLPGTLVKTDPFRLKVVVIGDPLVGKTSLIYAFTNGVSIEVNSRHLLMPGMLDVSEKKVMSEKKPYTLMLYDTDYNRDSRIAQYAQADIIVLCYSVADVNSLRQIDRKWIPELKSEAAGKPFVLIGCKVDLCETAKKQLCMDIVGDFDGMHMAAAIDSQAFFECSAITLANVNRIFEELCASVERHRVLTAQAQLALQKVNAQLAQNGSASYRPMNLIQSLVPIAKQSYHNIWSCISNPGAFVERKKAIVNYIPLLKTWIPYEDDVATAKENVLPQPTNKLQDMHLKRLLEDEDNEELQSKRKKEDEL